MLADGRSLNISDYPKLYDILSTNVNSLPLGWIVSYNKQLNLTNSNLYVGAYRSSFRYNKNNGTIINFQHYETESSSKRKIFISNDFGETWRQLTVNADTVGTYTLNLLAIGTTKFFVSSGNSPTSGENRYGQYKMVDINVSTDITLNYTSSGWKNYNQSFSFFLNDYFILYRNDGTTQNFYYFSEGSGSSVNFNSFITTDNLRNGYYFIHENTFCLKYQLATDEDTTIRIVIGTNPLKGNYTAYTIDITTFEEPLRTALLNLRYNFIFVIYEDTYIFLYGYIEIRTKDFINFEYFNTLYTLNGTPNYSPMQLSGNDLNYGIENTILFIRNEKVYYQMGGYNNSSTSNKIFCYDLIKHKLSNFAIPQNALAFVKDSKINYINSSNRYLCEAEIISESQFLLPNYNFSEDGMTNIVVPNRYNFGYGKPPTYIKVN